MKIDGTCEDCSLYTREQDDENEETKGTLCGPDICTDLQKLLEDGTCEDCEPYTRTIDEGKSCAPQACNSRSSLQIDGKCSNCEPYYL